MSRLLPRLTPLIPFVFVVLWSTGFIGAKYGLPYIEPFFLLLLRMLLTLLLFFILILMFKAAWPTPRQAMHQMVTGSLVHAAYLGGVFSAIKLGMSAGVVSIIVGLQPILTALIASLWLKQTLSRAQLLGLALGLAGVVIVLVSQGALSAATLPAASVLAAVIALFGISIGTLYQKRHGVGGNLLSGSFFQYLATAFWMALLAYSFETREVQWTAPLLFALAWLVLVLSVIAILLLMYMIRQGESAKVASYFYLVPPVTVIQAWLLFDETLSATTLAGIAITVVGVYLVLRAQPKPEPAVPQA